MEDQQLFQPLLSSAAPIITPTLHNAEHDYYHINKSFSSYSSIILRLFILISIGVISLWAKYEASKGFGITIINDIKDSPLGKRFNLLYMSNDKATRLIQSSSSFVENILYPNISYTKKKVNRVTLRLARSNITNLFVVETNTNHEFVITVSPSIVGDTKNLDYALKSIVLQGLSRVWLWDDDSKDKAPPWLIDGLLEYIKTVAGYGPMRDFDGSELPEFGQFCMGDKDPWAVAQFLDHCERHSKGFIQRLNQAMKDGWDDRTVEDALGISAQNICHSFVNSANGELLQ
ncbi:hypothetical protein P3X46_029364 [Hevea brasiliensis]|uniref:Uncharacterized protein n=1 Tax=Hevea brasiliensis TaxID=3981 RepID=A0ABQ9KTF2_HEVBR|nr:uncharacterized protein LOC110635106 isoform X1 [Hevea brasiliensis]KAJ9147172.1 hypothetical protein P3X46_029364 [Hevea brasiliensis]